MLHLGAALTLAWPASAATWTVDPAKSAIRFGTVWAGKPYSGQFQTFAATIDFDPARPAAAKIAATIDLASAATGDRTIDGALPGADWFDVKANRQARFTVASVAAAGPGRYVARGALAIRGQSVPVTLPFALAIAGDVATMTGEARLDRRAWKIGMSSDATADWVAFPVPVTVRIVARRNR